MIDEKTLNEATTKAYEFIIAGMTVEATANKLDGLYSMPLQQRMDLANKAVNALNVYKAAQTQTAVAVLDAPTWETPSHEVVDLPALNPTDTLGYVERMFLPGDWIDIQLIHQTEKFTDKHGCVRARTQDNFQFLEKVLEPTTPSQLVEFQNQGWNAYVAMNVFTAKVDSRKERDVVRVNSVYIEFDENGEEGLAKVNADAEADIIPHPHFKLRSSPGKFYVIWLVEGFDVPTQKAVNKALQVRYGSDPQSVDAARVLRLPGTRNLKYPDKPVVEIIEEIPGERCVADQFKVDFIVPKKIDRAAAPDKVQARMEFYEEACEIAGIEPGTLIDKGNGSFAYTVECPNWEAHTNKSKFDGSVWISPSGTISYACWHSHCADKKWADFYRPYLETAAKENGFEGKLKFGDASEVAEEVSGEVNLTMSEAASDEVVVSDGAVPTSTPQVSSGRSERITVGDIVNELQMATAGRNGAWQHGWAADFFSLLFGENYRYAIMGKTGDWMQWNGHMWHPGNVTTMQKRIDYLLQRIRLQIMPTLTDENLRNLLKSLERNAPVRIS